MKPVLHPPGSFGSLPGGAPSQSGQPLRICIASFDFVGPVRNGGVGTAFTSLGEALARAGHEVTLLFLPGAWCENRTMEHWIEHYRTRGIRFVPLPPQVNARIDAPYHVRKAYEAYLWLRDQAPFDLVHVSEWKGPGYFALTAKRQGLALADTKICVHTHGPTLWHKLSNGEYVSRLEDLETDYVERRSVALADVVVSPSHYLLRWMLEQGWQLPDAAHVEQYVRPATARRTGPLPPPASCPVDEMVFFGRLEVRKGIVLFCDALDQLKNEPEFARLRITFLGKVDRVFGRDASDYVRERARGWPWAPTFVSDQDQQGAMDYLQTGRRLAVLPSLADNLPNTVLECLGAQVPFLASRAGGIPEMIAAADQDSVCFPLRAHALADKLREAARHGVAPAREAVGSAETERRWTEWHATLSAHQLAVRSHLAVSLPSDKPLVSICMSHWNRPHYLRQAIRSIETQTYPNFEVVLIDDGSTEPAAKSLINDLESLFQRRNWRILRNRDNQYPGAARNRAVRHARGDYVMLMDDDNVAKQHELSTLMEVAKNTGADMVTCFLDVFSGPESPRPDTQPEARWMFLGAAAAVGAFRNCFGDTNSLVLRKAFLDLGGFHEDWGVGHEDWEFFARAVLRGYHLEVVPEPLAWYRLNAKEATVNRRTPPHANHMANIRPYLEAAPAGWRELVLFAQGQLLTSSALCLPDAEAYTRHSTRWRGLHEAARILNGLGRPQEALQLLLDAVKAAEVSRHPLVILEALLDCGQDLAALDVNRARQLLELAGKLAGHIQDATSLKRVEVLLAKLPVATTHKTRSASPATSALPRLALPKPFSPRAEPTPGAVSHRTQATSQPAEGCPHPLVSIIVLVLDQLQVTRSCLASVSAHTTGHHELILVDNGSATPTRTSLEELPPQQPHVQLIRNEGNRGFAIGNNQGLHVADGQFVVLLNNDTVVTDGWLDRMLAVFDRHPDTGIVGPMSNHVAGPQWVESVSYRSLEDLPAFARQWAHAHHEKSREVDRVIGFCLLARREVIERIGGLDERYGSGNFEDDDFCLRARLAGFKIRIAEDAFVHHVGGQTFRGAGIDYREAMMRNWELFKRKWHLPPSLTLETGYPTPERLVPGENIRVPLPDLAVTHEPDPEHRTWRERSTPASTSAGATADPSPAAVAGLGSLPVVGRNGSQNDPAALWSATLQALETRPFNPPAWLLLAQIAREQGAYGLARQCAARAQRLAPGWRRPRKLLRNLPKVGGKPADWMRWPGSVEPASEPTTTRLSVLLIARDEEASLGQCLASVKGLAHQIIVVDTGSTDRTVEIARAHGAEVHAFDWCDDFAAARNAALEHARGDWVLVLDADEELPPDSVTSLLAELKDPRAMAYRLPIVDAGAESGGAHYVPRLFRNAPGVFFQGRIHEHPFGSLEPLWREWGLACRLGETRLRHHGYVTDAEVTRAKVSRNLRLLRLALAEQPDDINLHMNLGLELSRSGQAEEALVEYRLAYRLAESQPKTVSPELREALLTQFCTRLLGGHRACEIPDILESALARRQALTASLHYLRGLACLEMERWHDAIPAFRQCLAHRSQPTLTPAFPEIGGFTPEQALACCLSRAGHDADAEKTLRDAILQHPQSPEPTAALARFLAEHQRPVEALELLHAALPQYPGETALWLAGGGIALSHVDYLEFACDWTREALKLWPDNTAILAQRAEALLLKGEADAALPLWRQAVSGGQPEPRAAVILCELCTDQLGEHVLNGSGDAVAREFIRWYQRLAHYATHGPLLAVNARLPELHAVLPLAAQALESALAEAADP